MTSIDLSNLFDRYTLQARLYPALLVIFPVAPTLLVWFPAFQDLLGLLVSVCVSFGVIFLLGQLGRDRGKAIEKWLYTQWDGKPSIAMLRWRDDRLDRFTKQRCHDYLKGAVTTAHFPNAAVELADPGLADEAYQAATQWLLDHTRDKTTFRLLFIENINYGFRRNMLGLRPFGIVVSLAVALLATGASVKGYLAIEEMPSMSQVIVSVVGWLAAACWIFWVRSDWVRVPAEQYARHLLAACTTLSEPQKPSPAAAA